MRVQHLMLLATGLWGCTGEDAGPTGPFEVTPDHVFASQSITVSGGGLDPHATDAWLEVDTLHLALADNGAGALGTTLPSWLNGSFSPVLHVGARSFPLSVINVYGFLESTRYDGVGLYGAPQTWKGAGTASLLGSLYPEGVAIFDLDNRQVERLSGFNRWASNNRQPGPTPDPGVWLFTSDTGANLEGWRLEPVPQRVAEYPVQGFRNTMLFAGGRWWRSSHHFLHLPDGQLEQAEEAVIGLFSPRGDRATLMVHMMGSATPATPVYDVASGEVSWRAPLRQVRGAVFSADGEYLAMVGGEYGAPGTRVMLFQASDGTVIRDSMFTEDIGSIAFDPDRNYLYLAATVADSQDFAHPEILVVERTHFGVAAQLSVRSPSASAFSCCSTATMVTSTHRNQLHVFWGSNGPIADWIFALPPD